MEVFLTIKGQGLDEGTAIKNTKIAGANNDCKKLGKIGKRKGRIASGSASKSAASRG